MCIILLVYFTLIIIINHFPCSHSRIHFCCSVTKWCLILCYPVDCNTPGFLVLHYLWEFAQIHVHWVGGAIQPSHPLPLLSPLTFHLSQHQSLSIESAFHIRWSKYWSFSISSMNIQGWFSLGLTGFISLESKGLSRVPSNTTDWQHQFFSIQPSLWSNAHVHTWLLEKP